MNQMSTSHIVIRKIWPCIFIFLLVKAIHVLSFQSISILSHAFGCRTRPTILYLEDSSSQQLKGFNMPSTNKLISDLSPSERGIGVGIDLGTTNSCISILNEKGIPVIVPVNGRNTMPSIVSLIPSKLEQQPTFESLVGFEAASARGHSCSGAMTYFNFKRVIGMSATTAACSAEVVPHLMFKSISQRQKGLAMQETNKKGGAGSIRWEQELKDARDSPVKLKLPQDFSESSTIAPEDLSALILKKLIHAVESTSTKGEKVTRAVVGVPAYFNDEQREATIKAVTLASDIPRQRIKLIREPEAAALAYGIGKRQAGQDAKDEIVLVFDLGGGTLDVTILEVGNGVMEIIATSGNNMLGGSDFDAQIANFISKQLVNYGASKNYWKEGSDVAMAMVASAEQIRIALSNARSVLLALPTTQELWIQMSKPSNVLIFDNTVRLPENETHHYNGTHVLCTLTRRDMEQLCSSELDALLRPIREVAILAGVMLPGDTSPAALSASLQLEEDIGRDDDIIEYPSEFMEVETAQQGFDQEMLLQINNMAIKDQKKSQQRGRKRAREVQKDEKKFREEKRKVEDKLRRRVSNSSEIKVRDGINGRRITQVVLVGGATRMPVITRLLSAVTGINVQRTLNPDEAVAFGCAIQVGILDGINEDLRVLSPIEAAMMRALAKKRGVELKN